MSTEQIDAHALLEELREMILTNINVDWDMQDAKDEFESLLEYIDRRRPVTEIHVGVEMYKGLVNTVVASKTDLEDPSNCNHIAKEDLYDETADRGWLQFVTTLGE